MIMWLPFLNAAATTLSYGRDSEHIPAADAAAWTLISLLFFCLTGFVLAAWIIARRKKRADMEAAKDLEQATDYVEQSFPKNSADKPPAWERDADWWKK